MNFILVAIINASFVGCAEKRWCLYEGLRKRPGKAERCSRHLLLGFWNGCCYDSFFDYELAVTESWESQCK